MIRSRSPAKRDVQNGVRRAVCSDRSEFNAEKSKRCYYRSNRRCQRLRTTGGFALCAVALVEDVVDSPIRAVAGSVPSGDWCCTGRPENMILGASLTQDGVSWGFDGLQPVLVVCDREKDWRCRFRSF